MLLHNEAIQEERPVERLFQRRSAPLSAEPLPHMQGFFNQLRLRLNFYELVVYFYAKFDVLVSEL